MASGDDVRVEVLGQIQVVRDGSVVPLSPQLRRLVGLLVVGAGEQVSSARLAEYVADGPAESTVRTAVSRARKVLGDRLVSGDGGYHLVLGSDELDITRFEALIDRSKGAPGDARVGALGAALDLWRGRAFGELADEEWAAATSTRLDLAKATATEDLADALLAAGRPQDAIELLEPHVIEHPYRERPVELLMRSLDAGGRRAEAVRAFQRFRTVLRDDTGLDPSNELSDLEARLLAADEPVGSSSGGPLPTGTVTFLFTDIEGSTQRWAEDEEAMASALAAHDVVLREAVESHGGVVFKHTGDGVCAAFESAPEAVAAAIDAQAQLELPVRMGLHTGEAELRDGDYFGPTLNRVARIMDAGHGGQVLTSAATAGLVHGPTPNDLPTLNDLGEHRLKGLSSPERIVQVGDREFPALRVATARKGNLPFDLTEFVGRTDELAQLVDHVADHRLVTLIGVGGTGKTRLAVEVANALAPTFPDGCWIVELSRVLVPEAVPYSIAAGIGVDPPERGDVLDHVVNRLRHQRALLIIDNCEHVLDAAADAVERIIASCPSVSVLATSREPIMVAGEHLVAVPSLSPAAAAELFVTRAGSESGDIDFDERQLDAVEELCERLDRLPLAIELAASRVRTMTPVEILDRLSERFRLLVGGRRSRMERHQTMRGTVDWSYEMCTEVERRVFDRLSVFVAEFDLEAARAVASSDDLAPFDVDDALTHLVDRSLVQRTIAGDGTTRFSLLETMRAYGREQLGRAGLLDEVRTAHASYVSSAAGALNVRSLGPDEQEVWARLRELAADSLVAVDWYVEQRDWAAASAVAHCQHFSSPGVAVAIIRRISAIALAGPEVADDLAPVDRAVLEIFWDRAGREYGGQRNARAQRDVLAWIETDEALERYFVGASPVSVIAWEFDDATYDAVIRYVGALDRAAAPAAFRFTVVHDLIVGLLFSPWWERADELRHELERLAEELDSETARRRCAGVGTLLAEARLDFATAVELAERSIAGVTVPTHHDALGATRVVRLRALSGAPVRGSDLRRPFEWCEAQGHDLQMGSALCSCAIALDLLGRTELARRLIPHVLPLEERPHYAAIFSTRMPEQLDALIRSEALPTEALGDVIADVFAVADELDRAAASA